jgi:isopropylmalate/homocitrate/citramalate synthase
VRVPSRETPSTTNILTGPFEARIEQPIVLYDNTLREGEQPPGVVFTSDEKLEIAQMLDEFGMHWANIGFPAVSAEERATCERIAKAGLKRMKLAGLARMTPEDIDIAVDCGLQLIAVFLGISDTHLHDKLHISEAEALKRIEAGIRRCKERGVKCSFGAEDGSRTPIDRLLRAFQVAADAGCDYLVLADTVGVLTPSSTYQIIRVLKPLLSAPIGLHFHDDLGLALANSLAGLEAGAEMVHTTVNGVGERSGNTCTEELAVALQVKYGIDLGLKLDRLSALCDRVHRASGTEPPAHKAITGKWCFSHESGIHVAGVLANPETYQPYPPALVGRHHEIVFGKHSGVQAVTRLAEESGLSLTEPARRRVLLRIKKEAERKQGMLTEGQILEWIRAEEGTP